MNLCAQCKGGLIDSSVKSTESPKRKLLTEEANTRKRQEQRSALRVKLIIALSLLLSACSVLDPTLLRQMITHLWFVLDVVSWTRISGLPLPDSVSGNLIALFLMTSVVGLITTATIMRSASVSSTTQSLVSRLWKRAKFTGFNLFWRGTWDLSGPPDYSAKISLDKFADF